MYRREMIDRLGHVHVKDKDEIIFYYLVFADIPEHVVSQVVDVVNLVLENKIDIKERCFEQTVKVNFGNVIIVSKAPVGKPSQLAS